MRVALKFFVVGLAFAHALALAPVSDEIKQAFGRFKVQYNKTYKDSMDEARRFKNFVSVYNFVAAYNKRFENGEVQSDVTINRFADMFPAELRTISTGTIKPPYEFSNFTVRPKEVVTVTSSMVPPGPASIDWLKLGHVTPVKDQGYTCNSCWAFSAVAALESALSIKYGKLSRASEQNLIDCNRNSQTGNFGCKGGSQAAAYMYIQYQPGIASEDSYPYEEVQAHSDPLKCRYKEETSVGTTTGYYRVLPGNETLLKDIVGSIGPVSIGLNGAVNPFYYYKSGILDDPVCTPGTDHGVLLYGYGTARLKNGTTIDYWLCKNSWSTDWGDKGFFKMVRGKNMCGLTSYVIYPAV